MMIGKLNEKCPECGCKDKTIKRKFESEHQAHATTEAVICSECGYNLNLVKHEIKNYIK